MSLVFAFEEDANVEINIEVSEGATDEEVAADYEEAGEEVEALFKYGANMEAAMDNLLMIQDHLTKFPITKAMLHLMNRTGNLGSALGINLPVGESDEVIEDVEDPIIEDEVELRTMVLESIGERIKGWKDAVVAFFKRLLERVKEFYSKHFGVLVRLEKRLKAVEDKYKNMSKLDIEAFEELKGSVMEFDEAKAFIESKTTTILSPVDTITIRSFAVVKSEKEFVDGMNLGVAYDVYDIEATVEEGKVETVSWKRKTDVLEKTDGDIKDQGWTVGNCKSILGEIKKAIKDLKDSNKYSKTLQKSIDNLSKLKLPENAGEGAITSFGKGLTNYKKVVSTELAIFLDVCKWRTTVVGHALSICDRVKFK